MMKVAILGKLPSKFEAPFEDKSWEIWAFNEHVDARFLPRVTKWFNLHPYAADFNISYTIRNFPFESCEKLVGGQYFNNTLSYLLAFAALQGAKEINLYGCNFTADKTEREYELANVREIVFFLKGQHIKIKAPYDSNILKPCYTYIDYKQFRKEQKI